MMVRPAAALVVCDADQHWKVILFLLAAGDLLILYQVSEELRCTVALHADLFHAVMHDFSIRLFPRTSTSQPA